MPRGIPGNRLALYLRAKEAIEYLMACDGHTSLSKPEFSIAMAEKYGRVWLRANGSANRQLVEDVCTLTRDQHDDGLARETCAGYIIAYAPSAGGMVLVDPATGNMDHWAQLHLLAGDIQRQQAAKTVNRRRIATWKEVSRGAMEAGDFDLARVTSQIEREIDSTGFVSDSLVSEYLHLVGAA